MLKIKPGYMLRVVADQYVVVPFQRALVNFNGMINLNESGAFIWRTLEQGATEDQIVDNLVNEYGIDHDLAKKDALEMINQMKEADLIAEC